MASEIPSIEEINRVRLRKMDACLAERVVYLKEFTNVCLTFPINHKKEGDFIEYALRILPKKGYAVGLTGEYMWIAMPFYTPKTRKDGEPIKWVHPTDEKEEKENSSVPDCSRSLWTNGPIEREASAADSDGDNAVDAKGAGWAVVTKAEEKKE